MRNFFPFMTAGPEISGLRADLIYANYIIACLLPLFVIFLCIRMVSSTKKAGVLTVLLAAVFVLFNRDVMLPFFHCFFWDFWELWVYSKDCTTRNGARNMCIRESTGTGPLRSCMRESCWPATLWASECYVGPDTMQLAQSVFVCHVYDYKFP